MRDFCRYNTVHVVNKAHVWKTNFCPCASFRVHHCCIFLVDDSVFSE